MSDCRKTISVLVFIFSVIASGSFAELCPLIKQKPHIDGKISEPVWKKAYKSANFISLDGKQKAEPETAFYVYSDGSKLYLAVVAKDPKALSLGKGDSVRDEISWQETVEVFLAPDVKSEVYYHFAFTPSGGLFDNITQANATDHNYDVDYKVARSRDAWILEAAFPLEQLGVKGRLKSGDEIDLNVGRSTGGERFVRRHHAWSATGDSFHNRKSLKRIVVGSYSTLAINMLKDLDKSLVKVLNGGGQENNKDYEQLKLALDDLRTLAVSINSEFSWKQFVQSYQKLQNLLYKKLFSQNKLIISRVNPWSLPVENPMESFANDDNLIDFYAIKGEVLDIALAVVNPSGQAMRIRCEAEDFVGTDFGPEISVLECFTTSAKLNKKISGAAYNCIKTYNAVNLGIKGGNTQKDALVEVGREHPITILPMQNEIIWLRIDTSKLSAGVWRGKIALKPLVRHSMARAVLLNLRVIPGDFPKSGKPYSCNWARYNTLATGGRLRKAAMLDQRFCGTNVHILPARAAGFHTVKFDAQGKPLGSPDFAALDQYIDIFGNKDQLYVFQEPYKALPHELGGGNNNSRQAKGNFKWIFNRLVSHLASRGLSLKNIAWYPVDEPDIPRAEQAIKFNKLLLEACPEAQIFCTIYSGTPDNVIELLCPYVNLWVVGFNTKQSQLNIIKEQTLRKPIRWLSYQVLSRASSPYWAYRVAGFKGLKFGYEGIGFWCYDDAGFGDGASTWDDFDGNRSDYAVVYEGNNGPQPSVRWRAWHQTIQSYRYIEWLKKLAVKTKNKKLAAEVKTLITQAIEDSISNRDSNTADSYNDKMRVMVVKLLSSLDKISSFDLKQINAPIEYCLTGNSALIPNYNTGGSYSYDRFPRGNRAERSGVIKNEVYFKGKEAKTGPQMANGIDGTLTDGSNVYPKSWIFWSGDSDFLAITFDFKKEYILSKATLNIDFYPFVKIYKSIAVYISQDKTNWKKIKNLNLVPITKVNLTRDKELLIDLGTKPARYVRFEIKTFGSSGHLGEIRIFGWSIDAKNKFLR